MHFPVKPQEDLQLPLALVAGCSLCRQHQSVTGKRRRRCRGLSLSHTLVSLYLGTWFKEEVVLG
ncbi:hypothetical protein Hanom_Chr09g00845881 [Helianthus anomalus]